MPRKNYLLFLSLLLTLTCWCQHAEQFAFTGYKLTDGLSSNIVNNLVQDRNGFIWLSTNNGLQRFDANKFITFKSEPGNPRSLPSDEIMQVYCDRKNNLWVATADNKVGIFNKQSFQYREVPFRSWRRQKLPVEKNFLEAADGQLFLQIKKTDRLFACDAATNAFIPSKAIPFPPGWKINFLHLDTVSKAYLMASDSGFAVYNTRTKTLGFGTNNPGKEPLLTWAGSERFVNYLFRGSEDQIFYEVWPPASVHPLLKQLDLKTGLTKVYNLQKTYGLGYHQITGMLLQRSGRMWIYGLPFLAGYDFSTGNLQFLKKDYDKDGDLKFNQVFSMYEDRQRNVWICTDYGIYLFNPDAQFFHHYSIENRLLHSVEGRSQTGLQLPDGEIWVGYRDLGLYRFSRQLQPLPLPPSLLSATDKRSVWDLHLHRATGRLWIALQGGQLVLYDTAMKKARTLSPPAFEKRAITQLAEDRAGNIWLGTQAGNLVKWDFKKGAKRVEDGFMLVQKMGKIEKLLTDQQGYLWVAAFGDGVLKMDPATGRIINRWSEDNAPGYQLWNNDPKDMLLYNDSLLIVASGALNLVNLHTQRVQIISNRQGLPSNTVQSLQKDAAGLLWLGTLNGLCMADISKLSFTVYNQSDGLLNDHFNVAGAHALRDGRLLFMSAENFLLFNPALARRKEPVAPAIITDVRLMNHSLPVDSLQRLKQMRLDYNATHLVIEFSALNFTKLSKLEYYYRLQNFDSTWIKSDSRHQAIYTTLPPGTYTFTVKTKNLAGDFSPESPAFKIRVYPPFWKTWWFFMLLLLALASVLYLLYRERIKRLVMLHNVRSDIASHLHHDVSTTLNNINVLSQIAKLKAEKDISRSKELIDEISGKSYNMMLSMDEILWSIDPRNDTMEKTLLRLFEFARMLETGYGTSITLVVHEKVKDVRLTMKVRHEFFIFCKEALQYLAPYAKDKSIMVDMDYTFSKILLKIYCSGAELDEASHTYQERKKAMENKAAALQAILTVDEVKNDFFIELAIPVKSDAFLPNGLFGNRKS